MRFIAVLNKSEMSVKLVFILVCSQVHVYIILVIGLFHLHFYTVRISSLSNSTSGGVRTYIEHCDDMHNVLRNALYVMICIMYQTIHSNTVEMYCPLPTTGAMARDHEVLS